MLLDEDLQIDTLDVLHDDVVGVFFMVDVVSANDVRVAKRCDRLGFPLEAFQVRGFAEFGFW